jgi:hypothetical protein
MTLTRLKRTLIGVAAALILTACAAPALPQPVAPYESRNLGTMINGRIVLATMQIRTVAGTSKVDDVGICVDGFDFPMSDGTITPAWLTVSSTRKFPPGQYTARACVIDGGHDQAVAGPAVPFTVR